MKSTSEDETFKPAINPRSSRIVNKKNLENSQSRDDFF